MVDVQGGPGQQLTLFDNAPGLLIAQTSGSSGDSVATSYANMTTGVLRDFAHATNAYPGTPYAATAVSQLSDSVVFSGGFGGTAYVDWSFDGSLAYTSNTIGTFGQLLVFIGSDYANIMLSANPGNCGGGNLFADCTVATSVNKQGSIAFTIQPGQMYFASVLQAYSQFGDTAAFGNSGKIYIRTPEGVSYTSLSGNFLTAAAPIFPPTVSPVPEPETYMLLIAGFFALAAARRQVA